MIVKTIISILFLFIASNTGLSQTNRVNGEYVLKLIEDTKHKIEYKLTLTEDGTFFFHSYRFIEYGIPQETQLHGKGNWSLKGTIVSFDTDDKVQMDDKHTLDFSNTKARFITKPLRDKTDRIIKTRIRFFESETFWIKGIDMFKL